MIRHSAVKHIFLVPLLLPLVFAASLVQTKVYTYKHSEPLNGTVFSFCVTQPVAFEGNDGISVVWYNYYDDEGSYRDKFDVYETKFDPETGEAQNLYVASRATPVGCGEQKGPVRTYSYYRYGDTLYIRLNQNGNPTYYSRYQSYLYYSGFYFQFEIPDIGELITFYSHGPAFSFYIPTKTFYTFWSPKVEAGCVASTSQRKIVYSDGSNIYKVYYDEYGKFSTYATNLGSGEIWDCRYVGHDHFLAVDNFWGDWGVHLVDGNDLTAATCIPGIKDGAIIPIEGNKYLILTDKQFFILEVGEGNCSLVDEGNVVKKIYLPTKPRTIYYPCCSSENLEARRYIAFFENNKLVLYYGAADRSGVYLYKFDYCEKVIFWDVKNEDGTDFDPSSVENFKITVDGGTVKEFDSVSGFFCGDDFSSDILRITVSYKVGNIMVSRTKYVANEDGQHVTIYIPDNNSALFYTIFVMDTQNNPLPGYRVIVEKYITSEGAYVSVSEAKSGPDGSTSHFLVPSTYYKIKVIDASGKVVGDYDWYADPNVRTIYIRVGGASQGSGSGTEPAKIEMTVPWEGVKITVPENNTVVENWPYVITISITDAQSSLDAYGGYIAKAIFDENTPLFEFNITGNPSGGTVEYNAWTPGLYIISLWVERNGVTYVFPPYQILLGSKGSFSSPLGVSDFTYILIAAIITMAVVGYTSQISPGASGILGLVVLGFFTLLNPSASVAGLSLWQIFLITAVFVIGVSFARTYL